MNFNFFKHNFSFKKTNRILLFLIILDILFILTHVLLIYLVFIRIKLNFSIDPFMLEYDGSIPEIFQYVKYFAVIVAIIYILYKKKEIGYVSWLFVFILLLLDDSLQFHENFGTWVVETFNYTPMFDLRAQDLGELTYVGIFGFIILIFLILGYYKGSKDFRKTNIDIGLLIAFFLFFGVVIDMFDEMIPVNNYGYLFFVILEDGGEMIALSLVTWYFMFLLIKPEKNNTYLYQYFKKK